MHSSVEPIFASKSSVSREIGDMACETIGVPIQVTNDTLKELVVLLFVSLCLASLVLRRTALSASGLDARG